MCAKAVLLGMNSPTGRCLEYDNSGAGLNLFKLTGLSPADYEAAFERMNLVQAKEWDKEEGERRGSVIRPKFVAEKRKVVVLGIMVWRCLKLPKTQWCHSFSEDGAEFWLVPHTSGKNLWYNYPSNKGRASRVLRRLAGEVLKCRKAS